MDLPTLVYNEQKKIKEVEIKTSERRLYQVLLNTFCHGKADPCNGQLFRFAQSYHRIIPPRLHYHRPGTAEECVVSFSGAVYNAIG